MDQGKKNHEIWNEEMAQRYNPDLFITKTGFFIRFIEAIRLRTTKKALACRDQDVVLDLGCGPGNLLEQLPGRRVVGLDLSESLLALAQKRVQGHPRFELIKAPAETIPFPDATFDRIVCSEVLEHVESPSIVVTEIKRVAKPGARVVLTLPNEELINFFKKIVIKFGLKKWIAGDYNMSDNMLSEWHKTEIEPEWVKKESSGEFVLTDTVCVPSSLLPLHRIFIFTKK